jgi:transglutaminase-like putative cysteine protease
MTSWLWHRIYNRHFITFVLLLTALCIISYGLSKNVLNISFSLMSILAIIGLVYSRLCSTSHMKDWHVALLTIFLGIIGSVILFAQLMKPMGTILNAIWETVGGVFTGSAGRTLDLSSINRSFQQMNVQFWAFFNHIMSWVGKILSGQVGNDKLVISMLWGLVFWLAVVWAGWLVFRYHSTIASILPATVMLTGSLNYVAGNPLYLVPLIGTTLILKAVTDYDQQEQEWVNHHVDYAEDIRFDLSIAIISLSLVFMFISVFAPSISISQIAKASQQIAQTYQQGVTSIAKSFGLEPQSHEASTLNSLNNPGLPRFLLVGSGPELSQDVIMLIETSDYSTSSSKELLSSEPPHYYWRSTVYDIYTGDGWATSSTELTNYTANQPAIAGFFPITGTLHLLHETILPIQDLGGMVYSAGQLILVDKNYQVAWRLSPKDYPGANQDHIADEFGAMFEGNSYSAVSFVNSVSVSQLRSAYGITPAWIQDRYLSLPDSLPNRVRKLAYDLTIGQQSEYDKAAALESYLRTLPYTLDLPAPPSGRDIVDYFLFDLKRGYCDYYASAMVVMARSIGLPARLVTGYATGSYDPNKAYYVVTQANAHSWVEVYLAGIGWVEFEPTGGVSAIQRPNEPINNIVIPQIKQIQQPNPYIRLRSIHLNWLAIFSGIIGIVLLGIISWVVISQWRLRHLSPMMTIVYIYQHFYHSSRPLVEYFNTGDTPYEYVDRCKQRLNKLVKNHLWNLYFRRGAKEAIRLTQLYTQVVYSPHPPILNDKQIAINAWVHLRRRLWLAARVAILKRWLSTKKSVQ